MLKLLNLAIGIGAVGASLVTARIATQHSGDRTERAFDLSVSGGGAKNIDIQAPIASVDLETGNYSDVSVHAVRWTKSPETSAGKHWMDDAHLTVTRSGDVVTVEDNGPNDQHSQSSDGKLNGGLELHIKAPAELNLDVHVGVGSVKPHGDLRSADIHVGAGEVNGRFGIERSSNVHVGAGSVELDVPSSENLDVDAHSGVGEIKGLPASADRSHGMHIGDNRSGRFGSGGPELSIHVGAGSIKIDSSVQARPSPLDESVSDGSRNEQFWADEAGSGSAGDVPDVGVIVNSAMATADAAVAQAKAGNQHDDADLSEIGPAIEKAMSTIGPVLDKTMSEIGPEIDRAMREAQPQMDKEMQDVGPEVRRALEKIRPEMERIRKETRERLHKALPEMEKAMKAAQASIDKAARDFDRKHPGKSETDDATRRAVREALKEAQAAMKESMTEVQKSLKDAVQDMDKD